MDPLQMMLSNSGLQANHDMLLIGLVVALSASLAAAQTTCENFGTISASDANSCVCPPGFGGPTCNTPSCGGNLFQGSQRAVSQNASTGGMSLTGCACEQGWGGVGCNGEHIHCIF
jgi:hypothetical protein